MSHNMIPYLAIYVSWNWSSCHKRDPEIFLSYNVPFYPFEFNNEKSQKRKPRSSNFALIWFFCVGSNVIWWKCFQLIAPDGPTHHCGFTENRTHKGTGGSFIKGDKQEQKSPWKGNLNHSLCDVPKRKYLLNQIDFGHKNTTTFRSFF